MLSCFPLLILRMYRLCIWRLPQVLTTRHIGSDAQPSQWWNLQHEWIEFMLITPNDIEIWNMQINHNQCRHIPNFDLIFWKNAVIDAACRRRMLRNTTWSQCWSSRAMKAMETFTNIWCIIFVMKLNLSKDVQLLRRTLIRLGYLTWLCSDPALGNTGLFAQPISGRNGSQAFSRCCKGRLEHAHDKSLNWPNLHIGKVRAVASVHRQAEKDPAMSLADQKSVWYIYIYIYILYIYIY